MYQVSCWHRHLWMFTCLTSFICAFTLQLCFVFLNYFAKSLKRKYLAFSNYMENYTKGRTWYFQIILQNNKKKETIFLYAEIMQIDNKYMKDLHFIQYKITSGISVLWMCTHTLFLLSLFFECRHTHCFNYLCSLNVYTHRVLSDQTKDSFCNL